MLLSIANIDGAVGAQEFEAALAAIQRQVREHFQPEWGGETVLRGSQAEMGGGRVSMDEAHDAVIYVGSVAQDVTRGVQSMLGHHTANRAGTPFGFVYLDVSAAAGESWTTTLSHEVIELLADPHASLVVTVSRPELSDRPVDYELEICDPTQGDTYLVDAVEVSNFVFRRYFALSGGDPTRTNMLNLDLEPFQVRPEGYVQYRVDGRVYQINGHAVKPARIAGRAALAEGRRNTRRAVARTSSSSAKHLPDGSIDKA